MKSKKRILPIVLSFADSAKPQFILSILFAVLSVFCGFLPYFGIYQVLLVFFSKVQDSSQISVHSLVPWFLLCVAGYGLKVLFHTISTNRSHHAAYHILKNIRSRLTDKLMRLPLGTVTGKTAGELKSIIVDRVETIELPLAHLIPEGLSNLIFPVIVFIFMLVWNWKVALASVACIPFGVLAYAIVMKTFNSKYDSYMKASKKVDSVIVEYVEGIEVVKAFNQSSKSYKKYTNAITSFKDFTLDWFRSTWPLMNFAAAILPSTLLGILPAGILLYATGNLTPAELTLTIILSLSLVGPVSYFTTAVNSYKSIEYALLDVQKILDLQELPEEKESKELSGYDISYKDVTFSYEEAQAPVVKDFSLEIPEESFVALVGPSGGGKSTLSRLLLRFWDVNQGCICIGGKDIRSLPLGQLSGLISYVSQDIFLFNMSLFENIRVGNPAATKEEVFQAAHMAQCEEFISRLEQGWDTPAGEAGDKLSGGEKQRIAIARAILKDAPIVVLDEATAFTDPENELQLQKSINELTRGKTLLVIAHRLSTIKNADKIVVLQEGTKVAEGTQNELLKACSLYRSMWKAHVGAKAWAASNQEKGADK